MRNMNQDQDEGEVLLFPCYTILESHKKTEDPEDRTGTKIECFSRAHLPFED